MHGHTAVDSDAFLAPGRVTAERSASAYLISACAVVATVNKATSSGVSVTGVQTAPPHVRHISSRSSNLLALKVRSPKEAGPQSLVHRA